MKRTNVMRDERVLDDALGVSGERTYSAAVGRALKEFVNRARARQILTLAGNGLWQGDLGLVREDRSAYAVKKARRGSR